MKNQYFKLILVTNKKDQPLDEYLKFVAICAKAGITAVQLREKNLSFDDLFEFGKQLQSVLKPFAIPLIVNDDVELACRLDAAGVHLGQSDESVLEARKRLGCDKIIGLSVDTMEQLHIANQLPKGAIDYIGVGAIFPTANKADVTTFWGCEGLGRLAKESKHIIVAIGGIDDTNAEKVMRAGAHGIAAIGIFHNAKDPEQVTEKLRNIVDGAYSSVVKSTVFMGSQS